MIKQNKSQQSRRLQTFALRGRAFVEADLEMLAEQKSRLSPTAMMNSLGLPLTIGLVLARDAGLKNAEVARAIELSARRLSFYGGKGAVP